MYTFKDNVKVSQVFVPEHHLLGPAMQKCNPLQQRFVIALLETGARDNTEAARLAGYSPTSRKSLHAQGWTTAHNPNVMAAIREEADKRLQSGALLAASVLVEICRDPLDKNRFKAAVELLNRAGLIVETRHRVVVTDNRTKEQMENDILAMAKAQGVDPRQLLGNAASEIVARRAKQSDQTIEGEFEEVSEERTQTSDNEEEIGEPW